VFAAPPAEAECPKDQEPCEQSPAFEAYQADPLAWRWQWVPRQGALSYVDWLLASLAGGCVYALANVARFLPKIKTEEAHFRAFTGWYASTVLRGCIIALVVLWLLTNLDLTIGEGSEVGLNLDVENVPEIALTAAAFILGFYGRVARAQLDEVTRFLFRRAWLKANEQFEVVPRKIKVVFGKQFQFRTDPIASVAWSAGKGTIDGAGLYTAPQSSEATAGTNVLIRAALQLDPSLSSVATVTLVPFRVVAQKSYMAYGTSQQMSVDGAPEEGVSWECSLGKMDGLAYIAPTKEEAETAGVSEVTITATSNKADAKPEDRDSSVIKLGE